MNGRKPVLFDRALKPEWLDYALDRALDSEGEASLRRELEAWLGAREMGVYTVQKTARQLIRTVGSRSPLSPERLESDRTRLQRLPPDQRNPIRLQLLYDANEFFADCCNAIRSLNRNGSPSVTMAQLYERLQAIYGHRGMIPRRVRYVLQTLALFGCLSNENKAWRTIEGSWLAGRA